MLPDEGFDFAVQDAPQNGDPTSAAKAMGAYYRCTLAQFRVGSSQCGN
jgi:hypothetical protein